MLLRIWSDCDPQTGDDPESQDFTIIEKHHPDPWDARTFGQIIVMTLEEGEVFTVYRNGNARFQNRVVLERNWCCY